MRATTLVLGLAAALFLAPPFGDLSAHTQAPAQQPPAAAPAWPAVDPAELAMTEAKVEPGADAEALLWDVRMTDGADQKGVYTAEHYDVRIKIFTDRGRDRNSTVIVPIDGNTSVTGIAGRTVRANGSIEDLKPSDIFERTLATVGAFSIRAKTLVLPGVERGSLIQYRYTVWHRGMVSNNLTLLFQRAIPVERAVYHFKPIALPGFGMKAQWYHATSVPFTREADGSVTTSQSNLPAFRAEPYMPPAAELQPWLFVFYVSANDAGQNRDPAVYWPLVGKAMYGSFKQSLAKISADVVKAAAPVKAATDLEGKIAAALAVTRTVQPLSTASPDLRSRYKPAQTIEDALKRGVGDVGDIRALFAALVSAAGLDVRPALAANRNNLFMKAESANVNFLPTRVLVVRSGDQSRYVDPLNRFSLDGGLRWYQENEPVLVGGDTDAGLARAPLSGASVSVKTRTAHLRLSEDGGIEGDLSADFTGHWSVVSKDVDDNLQPADREKAMKDSFASTLTGAAITNMTIGGMDSPKLPYSYSLHVKMAGYAQRTGSRLFVRPAVFQYGDAPVFAAASRLHPIYFPFPWTEHDTVTLTLPAGYEFEDATAPAAVTFGAHASYETTIAMAADRHEVVFTRSLVICGAGQILFPQGEYAAIKTFFDGLARGDGFALAVRKAGGH